MLINEVLEYKHTKHLIQAYYTKHSNISTPSLINACFFTMEIQAHPLTSQIQYIVLLFLPSPSTANPSGPLI